MKLTVDALLQLVDGELLHRGLPSLEITGIGSPEKAGSGDVVVLQKSYQFHPFPERKPAAIIVPVPVEGGYPTDGLAGSALIQVQNPKIAQIRILQYFDPRNSRIGQGVHPQAIVDPSVQLGKNITVMQAAVILENVILEDNVIIYPHVTVEAGAKIGSGSTLYPGVVIGERCEIGKNNVIYSGAVIGTDGFGYYDDQGIRYKVPQIGIVRTADFVEIGANVCIDRATIDETFIDENTKIDNLVQIGHNCAIGKKCYIVSQVGISGSTTLGNEVILGGQVGVADHCRIGDGVIAMAQSGIPSDLQPGERVFGTPARPVKESHRINAALPQLPALVKRVTHLEKKAEEIE